MVTLSEPNAVPIEVTARSLSGDPSFTLVSPPAVPFTLAAGGGSYTIDQSIFGDACGVTTGGTRFTFQAQGTATDGEGTIGITAIDVRDRLNVPIAAAAALPSEVTFDRSRPSQVTDVVAAQVKTGNDDSGSTPITLTFTVRVDAEAVAVWRAYFGNHPEYDAGPSPGALPARPTSYPPPAPWELTGITASGETHMPPSRDSGYYVVYGLNACANASEVSSMTGGLDRLCDWVQSGEIDERQKLVLLK